ncbi:Transcriptional regulatory protein ZraR [uncultured Eubacterium sp.]|nr:Transcriptional regulatory protein ZraR [uncultured Eubacterium sp.]
MKKIPILLVDDDRELLEVYEKIFRLKGFQVLTCDNSEEALAKLKEHHVSVVISDIIMPKMDGMELLHAIKKIRPGVEVIMLTAEGSISGAVEAVKRGAFSYFVKPADIEELISSVKKAEELTNVKEENDTLKEHIARLSGGKEFIGVSDIAENLRQKAEIIGKTDSAVLITGETGTGKEVLANIIHKSSKRAEKPFVCVNCGALNENLIESELFGSERGAYTGAERQRKGRFETADGGTIFFDEIGELSLNMQVKLLRVLQEKSFERVGGAESIKSDFRLITATNRDLKEEVKANQFRADLYYRINIIPIEIPPLRERREDIPILCESFLQQYAKEMNKQICPFEPDLLNTLKYYDWPGNVRELRNIIERLVVLSTDGTVDMEDLPEEIRAVEEKENVAADLKNITKAFEKEYIEEIMKKHSGNVTKAAEEMRIARKNLYRKLNDYGIKYR